METKRATRNNIFNIYCKLVWFFEEKYWPEMFHRFDYDATRLHLCDYVPIDRIILLILNTCELVSCSLCSEDKYECCGTNPTARV